MKQEARTEERGNERVLADAMQTAKDWLNQAIDGLRKAGTEHHIPRGLLARASYHRWCLSVACIDAENTGAMPANKPAFRTLNTGYADALQDLKEVYDIAERGGMRLFLTDYHLESARLSLTLRLCSGNDLGEKSEQGEEHTVFELSASEHLQKAKAFIKATGYKRRQPEVDYLEVLIASA